MLTSDNLMSYQKLTRGLVKTLRSINLKESHKRTLKDKYMINIITY